MYMQKLLLWFYLLGPQRGVPNILARDNNHTARIPIGHIPDTDEAIASFYWRAVKGNWNKLFQVHKMSLLTLLMGTLDHLQIHSILLYRSLIACRGFCELFMWF